AARELQAIELQRRGETRNLVGRQRELRRVHPNGVDRGADGERLAVAVSDGAAMGGDLEHSRKPGIALTGEKAVSDQLQVGGAPPEPERRERQQRHQESRTPAEGHRRAIAYAARLHGEIISISLGGGIAMWSRVLATRSTNAWVDQALCSSCSWPHSISRLSRRAFSVSSCTNSARARCLHQIAPAAEPSVATQSRDTATARARLLMTVALPRATARCGPAGCGRALTPPGAACGR